MLSAAPANYHADILKEMEIKPARSNVISGAMWRANVFIKTNVCLSSVSHVIAEAAGMSSSKLAHTESNVFSPLYEKLYKLEQCRTKERICCMTCGGKGAGGLAGGWRGLSQQSLGERWGYPDLQSITGKYVHLKEKSVHIFKLISLFLYYNKACVFFGSFCVLSFVFI